MPQKSENETPCSDMGHPPALSLWHWLLLAISCVVVLSFVAAHAPARIRLIGLFGIVFGLISGGLLGLTARQLKTTNLRLLFFLSLVLIACGEAGMTAESHRVYIMSLKNDYEQDIPNLSLKLLKNQNSSSKGKMDAEQQMKSANEIGKSFREDRLQQLRKESEVVAYLKHRISPLGAWAVPLGPVLWISEFLVGSLMGAWFAIYTIVSSKRLDENEPLG